MTAQLALSAARGAFFRWRRRLREDQSGSANRNASSQHAGAFENTASRYSNLTRKRRLVLIGTRAASVERDPDLYECAECLCIRGRRPETLRIR